MDSHVNARLPHIIGRGMIQKAQIFVTTITAVAHLAPGVCNSLIVTKFL